MRFCRYQVGERGAGIGFEKAGRIYSLMQQSGGTGFYPSDSVSFAVPDLRALMSLGTDTLERICEEVADPGVPVEDVCILEPLARPEKVICVGLNYRDHALETGKQPPSEPVIFAKLPTTVVGPRVPIILPALSNRVDFEAEFVVVIGKPCCHVAECDALEHVFGYCCGHDVSSRDWQYEHSGGQWLLGKSFDTFAPLGPFVVHRSRVPHPDNLRIQMRLNGQVMQDSSTQELIFSVPKLISYLSQIFTLNPGDLIFTGTPAGVGVARKPPRFLQPGDECEVEIESLGVLTNRCVSSDSAEAEAYRNKMRNPRV